MVAAQGAACRVGPTLALLTLVTVSGCAALAPSAHDYPPGVTESGVDNASALADAHASHLREGFRLHTNGSAVASNGTVVRRSTVEHRWSPGAQNRSLSYRPAHERFGVHAEYYRNDSVSALLVVSETGNRTVHVDAPGGASFFAYGPGDAWDTMYGLASAGNVSVEALDDGRTKLQVEDARVDRGRTNATLWVTPDGLVARYELRYETGPHVPYDRGRETVWITNIGDPDVVRPSWVENVTADR